MREKILIIGEMKQEKIRTVTFECLSAANGIAADAEIVVLLYGKDKTTSDVDDLLQYKMDKILWISTKETPFSDEAYRKHVEAILKKEKPAKVFIPHTDFGKSIAAYLSKVLAIPLLSNVNGMRREKDSIVFTRSIFSGKLNETVRLDEDTFIAAIKPNSWVVPNEHGKQAVVIEEQVMDKTTPVFPLLKVEKKNGNSIDLLDAKVIVAAGRGIKNTEGMELIKKLASLLGGTVGVSRGAVELGLSDSSLQVGQTGKTVGPDLYIACGISGAIQHIVGMNGAKVVVAINNDPDAPIFKEADYCIVGDIFEVVPLLIQQLEGAEYGESAD
ncbi:electron transfer flavoprotein subunit alpha/FixB family protein [Niallia sp. 01092]|uniref:electron transfer flavoprotein subunit alpha/FixB family protein n=1 Tax=unclassified Niallia TaxID=2837522 RepID=UPI003FD353E0